MLIIRNDLYEIKLEVLRKVSDDVIYRKTEIYRTEIEICLQYSENALRIFDPCFNYFRHQERIDQLVSR